MLKNVRDPGPPKYNPGAPFRLSSLYGFRKDPFDQYKKPLQSQTTKPQFHSGHDYAAPAGTPIPAAAAGVVVYSGFNKNLGNVAIVRNDRGDYSLYGHMQEGRVQLGQRISEKSTVGLVGETGERAKGVHLHYSAIRPEAGKNIESTPRNGGPIGVHLDGITTYDPAGSLSYLDDSQHAAQIMSGTANPIKGTLSSDRPGDPFFSPFGRPSPPPLLADRFVKWGSVPAGGGPPVKSDAPATLDERFGNWGISPAGGFGNVAPPMPRALEQNRRSALPDGLASSYASDTSAPGFGSEAANNSPVDETRGMTSTRPVRYLGKRMADDAPAANPAAPSMSARSVFEAPLSLNDAYLEYQNRLNASQSPTSLRMESDPRNPMPSMTPPQSAAMAFAAPNSPYSPHDLARWLAANVGADPQSTAGLLGMLMRYQADTQADRPDDPWRWR